MFFEFVVVGDLCVGEGCFDGLVIVWKGDVEVVLGFVCLWVGLVVECCG